MMDYGQEKGKRGKRKGHVFVICVVHILCHGSARALCCQLGQFLLDSIWLVAENEAKSEGRNCESHISRMGDEYECAHCKKKYYFIDKPGMNAGKVDSMENPSHRIQPSTFANIIVK
jgi:hypothetical protein